MKAAIAWSTSDLRRAERLVSKRRRPAQALAAVDTVDDVSPIWLAKRPDGRGEVLVCATHLMKDSGLSNAAPAAEGSCCVFCTELVSPTRHAVDRWLKRVGGRNATEAGLMIMEFAAKAFTPAITPAWIEGEATADELLLNLRYDGVALLKRRSRDPAVMSIVTVLTSAGPNP
jgi:hypothetical protein